VFKAAALVDGIVQLGERICKFAVVDEELKPLGKPGVLGGALGERGDLDRKSVV